MAPSAFSNKKTAPKDNAWTADQRYTMYLLCSADEYAIGSGEASIRDIWMQIHGGENDRKKATLKYDFDCRFDMTRNAIYRDHIEQSWNSYSDDQKKDFIKARQNIAAAATQLGITLKTPKLSKEKSGSSACSTLPRKWVLPATATIANATANSTPASAPPSTQAITVITTDPSSALSIYHYTSFDAASPVLPPATKIPLQWSDINPLDPDELSLWREEIDDSLLHSIHHSHLTRSDAVLLRLDAEEGRRLGVGSGAAVYKGSNGFGAPQLHTEVGTAQSALTATHTGSDVPSEMTFAHTLGTREELRAITGTVNADQTSIITTGKAKKRSLLTNNNDHRKAKKFQTKPTAAHDLSTDQYATRINVRDFFQVQDSYSDEEGYADADGYEEVDPVLSAEALARWND
nr:hypothetical protein B0A51_00135 [Rachicladosporium sp. CCFEE 5018]